MRREATATCTERLPSCMEGEAEVAGGKNLEGFPKKSVCVHMDTMVVASLYAEGLMLKMFKV